jgi:peptidyl-tRNA hydrolase
MLLLVGLGNPGAEYAKHRHNIGFMAIDAIAERHKFGPWRKKFQGECADGTIVGQKCLALKPQNLHEREWAFGVRGRALFQDPGCQDHRVLR